MRARCIEMGLNTGFHLIEILPQPLVLKPDPCIAIRACFGCRAR